MEHFGVGPAKASLGLGMYVLGCEFHSMSKTYANKPDGLGPLLWSPMSEIPIFGRNVPYLATFAVYIILCVPTALADNFGGLLVLRFITGFFGSPCLANGAATMQDMVSAPTYDSAFRILIAFSIQIYTYLTQSLFGPLVCCLKPKMNDRKLTSSAAFLGPSLGPLLSGFSVPAEGYVPTYRIFPWIFDSNYIEAGVGLCGRFFGYRPQCSFSLSSSSQKHPRMQFSSTVPAAYEESIPTTTLSPHPRSNSGT